MITCVIDGFVQECFRPQNRNLAEYFYSGHMKEYEVRTLLVTTCTGKILWHSPSCAGSYSDLAILERSDIVESLRPAIDPNWDSLLGDAGFEGAERALQRVFFVSRHRGEEFGQTELSQVRAVVENVIAQLRCWRVLDQRIRFKPVDINLLEEHNRIINIVAGLYNRFRVVR